MICYMCMDLMKRVEISNRITMENGGFGNDWVRAEAQDGSGSCNANMFTPPDVKFAPNANVHLWE